MLQITKQNIDHLPEDLVPRKSLHLLDALLEDIEHANRTYFPRKMQIWVDDTHSYYSAERVDPCPDFYGTFSLYWEGDIVSGDDISCGMTVEQMDEILCGIHLAFEFAFQKHSYTIGEDDEQRHMIYDNCTSHYSEELKQAIRQDFENVYNL